MVLCRTAQGGEKWKKAFPLLKICHRYPTMMKLGAVIPYLKKIQKICKSRNNFLTTYLKKFVSPTITLIRITNNI